jgi:uncharacterized membrane protein YbhN (UPF0104 family)
VSKVRRRAVVTVLVAVFVVVALGFFVYAIVNAWHQTGGEHPSVLHVAGAAVLYTVGLIAAAYAWATLLGDDRKVDHGAALLVSQLGKYVPGGAFQATGQVGLARSAGVRVQRGVTAFSVLVMTQALAGAVFVFASALVWTSGPVGIRVLMGIAGIAPLFLLDRRWMVWGLRKIPRTREASAELIPDQRHILIAWSCSIVTLTATSCAYLLVLASFGGVHDPALVICGYAAAWTAGFVVLPIPSGLGVREAVLAALLHGAYPNSVIVAASVYHRVIIIATEGIVALIALPRVRPARLAAARAANPSSPPEPASSLRREVE